MDDVKDVLRSIDKGLVDVVGASSGRAPLFLDEAVGNSVAPSSGGVTVTVAAESFV